MFASNSVYKQNEALYIESWKKHTAQRQLLKFLPNTCNPLYKRLSMDVDGYACLQYMDRLTVYYREKDHENFTHTLQRLCVFLEKNPTLIGFFPVQIMTNLRLLRQYNQQTKPRNVIYLTKDHVLPCALCGKNVQGNLTKKAVCLCSTNFYHKQCYDSLHEKCEICSYVYEN